MEKVATFIAGYLLARFRLLAYNIPMVPHRDFLCPFFNTFLGIPVPLFAD